MDEVVQSTAASAEEAAATSQQLSSQSRNLQAAMNQLEDLVGSNKRNHGNGKKLLADKGIPTPLPPATQKKAVPGPKPQAKKVAALAPPKGEGLSPEQVIPLGDEHFKEF